MKAHKKGYTLIETLLSLMLSLGVVSTVLVIPHHIRQSHLSYQDETTYNHAQATLSLAIQEDASRYLFIEEGPEGFVIGPNAYRFTAEGVTRFDGKRDVLLTAIPLAYTFDETHVHLTGTDDPTRKEGAKTTLSLSFPIKNNALMHAEWGGSE